MHDSLSSNFDSTAILALITASILLVIFTITQDVWLVGLALVYGIGASIWIYRQSNPNQPAHYETLEETSTPLDTRIPEAVYQVVTTRMGVTVDGLVRASDAINDVTRQQSDSAQEQATFITTANHYVDQFLELSEEAQQEVRTVNRVAQQASDISETGIMAIAQSLVMMQSIRQQVEAIGGSIVRLAQFTERIDKIIISVSEIATQSNLLALNASIEAARAGQHGQGFAVVADEVRRLARQSTESATQVRRILNDIQLAMRDTVDATQQGMSQVDEGLSRTQEANNVMGQLAKSVDTSRNAVKKVSDVLRQQSDGMEEISIRMDRVQRITQQNLASTRTIESVSANLSRLAGDLQDAVQLAPQEQAV